MPSTGQHEYNIADINGTVDSYIDLIRSKLQLIDILQLENTTVSLPTETDLHLSKGTLKYFAQVKRAGSCTATFENNSFAVKGVFGWDRLYFFYQYHAEAEYLRTTVGTGDLLGQIQQLEVRIVLEIVLDQIVLKQIDFIDDGKIHVEFLGPKDSIHNRATVEAISKKVKQVILKAIREKVKDSFRYGVMELNGLLLRYKIPAFKFVDTKTSE